PAVLPVKPNIFKDYALAYDAPFPGRANPATENCCPERSPQGNQGPYTGMGWVNSQVRMANVTDVTSSTFLIMEKAHNTNHSWCSKNMGCNEFFWVHHQSQGFVFGTRPP